MTKLRNFLSMKSVIGIGSAITDILTHISSDDILARLGFPRGSMQLVNLDQQKVMAEVINESNSSVATGGSAANTIGGISKMGGPAAFIGTVGDDAIGRNFAADLTVGGTAPLLRVSDTTPSGRCIVMVSPDSERTMGTYLGAGIELLPEQITEQILSAHDYFYIEGYLVANEPIVRHITQVAKRAGIKTVLDLASFNVVEGSYDFLHEIAKNHIDIIFANEDEARSFTGLDAEAALDAIAQMCDIAIVKIGPRGAWVKRGDEKYRIGVIDATPVDKTGAGDLFAAGFLYGMCKELPLKMCGDIGAVLSSNVIEFVGPKMPEERWQQIRQTVARIEAGEDLVTIFE